MKYTTKREQKARIVLLILIAAVVFVGAYCMATGRAEGKTITCWILCKQDDFVNIRTEPDKGSRACGFLEVGDDFQTDGKSRNGFIRVLDRGESAEAWIYAGYVVTEKPEEINQNYVVVAKNRVAARRWVDGPQVVGRPWLKNGSEVMVYYIAEGWALTNRGYIRAEWLEEDPK